MRHANLFRMEPLLQEVYSRSLRCSGAMFKLCSLFLSLSISVFLSSMISSMPCKERQRAFPITMASIIPQHQDVLFLKAVSRERNLQSYFLYGLQRQKWSSTLVARVSATAPPSRTNELSTDLPPRVVEELEKVRFGEQMEIKLPQLDADELQRLQLGERVQKQERRGRTGYGYAVMDVNAPPNLVLSRLAAFEDYPSMIPIVRRASVKSRACAPGPQELPQIRCSYTVSKFMLGIDAVHVVDPNASVIRFELDPGGTGFILEAAKGFWYVEALGHEEAHETSGSSDEKHLCRVWFFVCVSASWFVPSKMVEITSEKAIRKATAWLKPYMEDVKKNFTLDPS